MAQLLHIYLNDHLAASTGGLELARRTARSNQGNEYGDVLEELVDELADERQTLLRIMERLGAGVDRPKVLAAWSAEKLGRLKLNGSLTSYSPLSRLVELEGLQVGVHAKLLMWEALDSQETGEDLEQLRAQARSQRRRLERLRRRAASEALAS